jgi:hypothetical protein
MSPWCSAQCESAYSACARALAPQRTPSASLHLHCAVGLLHSVQMYRWRVIRDRETTLCAVSPKHQEHLSNTGASIRGTMPMLSSVPGGAKAAEPACDSRLFFHETICTARLSCPSALGYVGQRILKLTASAGLTYELIHDDFVDVDRKLSKLPSETLRR